jgi:CubicO group peptidase (beta-lactamase class C family)
MTRREIFAALTAALTKGKLGAAEKILNDGARQAKPRSAVLAVQEGGFHYLQAFGEAQPDSLFLIASITKPMTAAGVMWLEERGKLRLTDSASQYLPEFRGGGRETMTIGQMLSHTCGLPDMLPENTALRQRQAPLDEYVRLALRTPLLFAPGTEWRYSSTGILLASEIARRVDGRPIAQLLREEIYQPWGMNHAVLGLPPRAWVPSQTEYAPTDLGNSADAKLWDWNSPYWRGLGAPWGGAHSTASDVMRFLNAFLNQEDGPLKPSTRARMIENQNAAGLAPYGIGFGLGSRLGSGLPNRVFGHGGSTGTLCWADPARKRAFVLLTSMPLVASGKTVIQPASQAVFSAS